jgi:hypothetical protein
MAWQTNTVNPATTTPAVDITKITNDLQQLRSVIGGGTDTDIPVGLTVAKTNNLIGSTIGSLWYQSALDTTAQLAVGTGGQVLQSGGTGAPPTWTSAPDFTTQAPGNNTTKASTTAFVTAAVAAAVANILSSNSWTPTTALTTNITTVNYNGGRYIRVGNVVHATLNVTITPTANSTLTLLGFSLPIASNMINNSDLNGSGVRNSTAGYINGSVSPNLPSDYAVLAFNQDTSAGASFWEIQFQYVVQ